MKADWSGPAFYAVAWIPYHPLFRPANGPWHDVIHRARGPKRMSVALLGLFRSGNPRPPRKWRDSSHFGTFIAHKGYRGVFYLTGVRLEFDEKSDVTDIGFDECVDHRYVGYTPLYLGFKTLFSAGRGYNSGVAKDHDSAGGTLSQEIGFRLSWWANFVNWVLTDYWAPYAWMRVTYRLYRTKDVVVEFTGSHIPTQTLYLDGATRLEHEMMALHADDIRDFINAPANEPAHPRPTLTLFEVAK